MKNNLFRPEAGNLAKEEAASGPIVVKNFEAVSDMPEIEPALKDFAPVLQKAEKRQHSFDEARKAFLYVFEPEKIKKHLAAEPTKQGQACLKKIRRIGLVVRAMYIFFDTSHLAPRKFHAFISDLGDYNDEYWSDSRAKILAKMKEQQENWGSLSEQDLKLNAASGPEFSAYAKNLLEETSEFLNSPSLSKDDFHTVRKNIRSFGGVIQVLAAENLGQPIHWLCASLFKLSRRLGRKRDKALDQHSDKIKVEPEIAEEFILLRPYIEKVMGV